jgi:hypothetical protein
MDTAALSLVVSGLAVGVAAGGVLYAKRSTTIAGRSERLAESSAEAAHRSAGAAEATLAIDRERAAAERSERADCGPADWRILGISLDDALGVSMRLRNRGGAAHLYSARLEGDLWFGYCDRLLNGAWVEMSDDPVAVGHMEEVTVGLADREIVRSFQGAGQPHFTVWSHTPDGAYRSRYGFALTRSGGPYGRIEWQAGAPDIHLE